MAYLHEFPEDSIFRNSIKTAPQYTISMYSGSMFVNDQRFLGINSSSAEVFIYSNQHPTPLPHSTPTGSINLYELNVGVARSASFGENSLIRPFLQKDGTYRSFKSITSGTFNHAQAGDFLFGKYPLTSSIQREFIPGIDPDSEPYRELHKHPDLYFKARKRIIALRNTLDYYLKDAPTFRYTSSIGESDTKVTFTEAYETASVNLISIPSIFFNSGIQKGSVSLKFYVTGTLIDEAQDIRQNGELVSITTTSPVSGQVVGNILYNEGFILLTCSTDIGSTNGIVSPNNDLYFGGDTYEFDTLKKAPRWIYFGAYASGTNHDLTPSPPPSASMYEMSFRGTNEVPTMTMFAEANAGDVNCSQNPTWISSSMKGWQSQQVKFDQGTFQEPQFLEIKNVIQSDFCNYEEPFEKQVFISKIGIFDKDKNLIGVAKLANPVLKKESDDFTFKLKMDF